MNSTCELSCLPLESPLLVTGLDINHELQLAWINQWFLFVLTEPTVRTTILKDQNSSFCFAKFLIQGVTANPVSGGSDSPEFGFFHSLLLRLFMIYFFRDECQLQQRLRLQCSCEHYYMHFSPSASLSSSHPMAHILAQIISYFPFSVSLLLNIIMDVPSKWIWRSGIGQFTILSSFFFFGSWLFEPSPSPMRI